MKEEREKKIMHLNDAWEGLARAIIAIEALEEETHSMMIARLRSMQRWCYARINSIEEQAREEVGEDFAD